MTNFYICVVCLFVAVYLLQHLQSRRVSVPSCESHKSLKGFMSAVKTAVSPTFPILQPIWAGRAKKINKTLYFRRRHFDSTTAGTLSTTLAVPVEAESRARKHSGVKHQPLCDSEEMYKRNCILNTHKSPRSPPPEKTKSKTTNAQKKAAHTARSPVFVASC